MAGDRVPAGWWPDGSVRGPEGANYPQSGQALLLGGREDSGGLKRTEYRGAECGRPRTEAFKEAREKNIREE